MKITFVMPIVDQNGGSRVVASHALELIARGHDVTVVSRRPHPVGRRRQFVNLIRGQRERPNPDRTRFFDPLGEKHIQITRAGPLLPEDLPDADVVIATWWRTAFEVMTMPPEKGAKVYFIQGHEVHDHLPWDLGVGSYWLPLNKIVVSPWLADIMADRYDAPDVPIVLNSVDTALFDAPPRERGTPPRVGLLYAPTFPMKGTADALTAISAARDAFPDLEVVSFGYHAQVPDVPLPDGTTYRQRPPQQEIVSLYASADVWLSPSHGEGFGLPILEAMACRTPVIATRTGGAESFVVPGETGALVEPGDADGMGRALVDMLAQPADAWKAMSDAAHDRVHSWTWKDAAAALEAELTRIVGTT